MEKKILTWIHEHNLIPVMAIEKAANIPVGTLKRALLTGHLPPKHTNAIATVIKHYGFNY